MIEHKLCRPPRGVQMALALRPTDKPGCASFTKIDLDQPALAFMSRDKGYDGAVSFTIWVPDCYCHYGEKRCPRARMLRRAARGFGTTSVVARPGLSARALLDAQGRTARPSRGRSIR